MSTFNKYRVKGAYHYDWYKTEQWYQWMIDKAVGFCRGATIDIGCGEGLLVDLIDQSGFIASGIDLDPDAISLAYPDVDINIGDVEHDSFAGQWDYMSCLNVIEHLAKPEVLKRFIRNNVRKGAIITTIDWQGGAFGEDHDKEYTLAELVDFFKEFKPKPFRWKDTEWIGVEIKK